MTHPFLSVVIANYNFGCFLEDAIQSVVQQDGFDQCELIVVDGGSTDNSIEIIKHFSSSISWWCSESDEGQSAAFNKGFSHAHGRFLTWLNADDIMLPGTIRAVRRALDGCPNADWATGNMVRFNQYSKELIEVPWGPHYVPFCMQGNGFPLSIFGPTTFWSSQAYDELGPISEQYHFTMDSDYWRRLTMGGYKYVRVNRTCWAFRMHNGSKTAEFDNHKRNERRIELMHGETRDSELKTGYRHEPFKKMLKDALRVIDGSLFVYCYRRIFLFGKSIEKVYDIKLGGKK